MLKALHFRPESKSFTDLSFYGFKLELLKARRIAFEFIQIQNTI